MSKTLLSWVGTADLRASADPSRGLGPLAQALADTELKHAFLLCDYSAEEAEFYFAWLRARAQAKLHIQYVELESPVAFGPIYEAARARVLKARECVGEDVELLFHLSPGTPSMAAVWIILAKTRFPATLLQSSREGGVRIASVPFDLSAEYLPDLVASQDRRLRESAASLPPQGATFGDILYRSPQMDWVVRRARRVASRDVPVLIEGESGTGKELLARAIHDASPRRDAPFVAVNCGALPEGLVASELFGHVKGAFSGATRSRLGHFRAAQDGTVFLDELGELPLEVQVMLLRVLQQRQVTPVGASDPAPMRARIIAATNRRLLTEVSEGRFREDLFYRLAVAVLVLPPLREREGDLGLLLDATLSEINRQSQTEPGWTNKSLSVGARNLLHQQVWPGNVRELKNTLLRAAIWSEGPTISEQDVRDAVLERPRRSELLLGRPLGHGLDVRELISELARHYLGRAMEESGGVKTRAAELVGLPSYQTLSNWLERYGLEP